MPEAVLQPPAPGKPVRHRHTVAPGAPSSAARDGEAPDWLVPLLAKHGLEPHDGWPPAHHQLTERDLPSEDGEEDMPVHTAHDQICLDLRAGLERRYRDRGDVLVAHDLFIYFDGAMPGRGSARRVSPDLFVAFGVPRRGRGSLAVWEERRAPAFVLEVLSEETWRNDIGEKVTLYQAMGVREYFLFDPHGRAQPRLQGWAYRDSGPKPAGVAVNPSRQRRALSASALPSGMRGIRSEALGLHLCHTDPWPNVDHVSPDAGKVRWFDADTNRLLETYQESEQRQATETRAATQRADALAAELEALKARLRAGEAGRAP